MSKYYSGLPVELLEAQGQRLKGSKAFRRSKRLTQLFEYIFEETLLGRADSISQYTIAYDCFGIKGAFDTSQSSLIRTHVLRLRKALGEYFEFEGKEDDVYIRLAEDGYKLIFSRRGIMHTRSSLDKSRPIIGVCRFSNISTSPELLDLSTVLADELVNALSAHRQWNILGPLDALPTDGSEKEKLDYAESFGASILLDGSIHVANGKHVVIFRLRCLKTHLQVWSHRCECNAIKASMLDELNAVCAQAAQYLGSEHGVISNHLHVLASLKPQQSQTIFDLVVLCWSTMRHYTFSNISNLIVRLRNALKEDGEDPALNASLGFFLILASCQPQFEESISVKVIENHVNKAVFFGPNEVWTLIARAFLYALKDDTEGLAELANRVIDEGVANQTLLGSVGICLCLQNVMPEKGLWLMQQACSLNPGYPKVFHIAAAVTFASRVEFDAMFRELKQLPSAGHFPAYRGTTEVDVDALTNYPKGAWGEPLLRAFYHSQQGDFEETSYYWNLFLFLNNGSAKKARQCVRVLWNKDYVDQFWQSITTLLRV